MDGKDLSDAPQYVAKRLLIGDPLTTEQVDEQLLPKRMALPIFASDALSSVAYAPQELLMILALGGLAFLSFAPWVAAAVVLLLTVVVLSYRQLIKAYPSGGGDYEVASKNLGEIPGVVVAAALLVDYVLTVSVSVASGVDNIISALPQLDPMRVELAVGFVIVIIIINLRGVREASLVFAIPTYVFIGSVAVMIVVGLARTALGDAPVASSADFAMHAEDLSQAAVILLVLRAFSSGCSALTGVEAVSNGVPAFRAPKVRNAQMTLTTMGTIAVCLFAGLTALALISGVHYAENPCALVGFDCTTPQPSLMAQAASATFGAGSIPFYLIQAATACVLLLAANTAFNGFPVLGSILAKDGYAPRALGSRGDRLAYSNGIVFLAIMAIILIYVFDAEPTRLIQLYIVGVFVSFNLSQLGMIRHWTRHLRTETDPAVRRHMVRSRVINAVGLSFTAVVLVVVLITKFLAGAWITILAMAVFFVIMRGIRRHYDNVNAELAADEEDKVLPTRVHAIVLVGKLHKPTLRALAFAKATRPNVLEGVYVSTDAEATARLMEEWEERNLGVPLKVLHSPYRELVRPIVDYAMEIKKANPRGVVAVYIPEYVVGKWWEQLLHNQTALRLKGRLLFAPGVMVTSVPYQLRSSELVREREERLGVWTRPTDYRLGNVRERPDSDRQIQK